MVEKRQKTPSVEEIREVVRGGNVFIAYLPVNGNVLRKSHIPPEFRNQSVGVELDEQGQPLGIVTCVHDDERTEIKVEDIGINGTHKLRADTTQSRWGQEGWEVIPVPEVHRLVLHRPRVTPLETFE